PPVRPGERPDRGRGGVRPAVAAGPRPARRAHRRAGGPAARRRGAPGAAGGLPAAAAAEGDPTGRPYIAASSGGSRALTRRRTGTMSTWVRRTRSTATGGSTSWSPSTTIVSRGRIAFQTSPTTSVRRLAGT